MITEYESKPACKTDHGDVVRLALSRPDLAIREGSMRIRSLMPQYLDWMELPGS